MLIETTRADCRSLPVNGSILAVMPWRIYNHRIFIEFHKPIVDYEKK